MMKDEGMVGRQAESKPDNWALSDMTLRRAEIIDEVCERLALGETLSRICAARDLPDRRTIHRWAVKDRDLADRILTARRLGGWAMFDEATDRLMNATPQTIQRRRLGGKRRPSLQSLPATSPAKVAGADGS
ncbi:MAG: hypothetical protein VCE74_04250 [Alphaproteobacteria bacterium]